MSLYRKKYRIESNRLRNWDYASNGFYYLTICTLNRIHYFGNIINYKMILSQTGRMAYNYWNEIPCHFPFVQLDEFIIMPNHIHGILIINNSNDKTDKRVERHYTDNKFGPQSKNIGSIIRGFKIGVTKQTKNDNISFGWQPRFYDHIIRNNQDLIRIRNYIQNNPRKWKNDGFYKKQ